MSSLIQNEILTLLPAQRKTTNKWISFNAPCCVHNGETADQRKRGGVIVSPDGGVSYHCFNCGFKTSYRPGRNLTYKFKRWLEWMGASDNQVQRFVIEALRIKDSAPLDQQVGNTVKNIKFTPRPLPNNSASLKQLGAMVALKADWNNNGTIVWDDKLVSQESLDIIDYLGSRMSSRYKKYDFYYTEETSYNLHRRVIIPFYWQQELIGYTARAIKDDIRPKYHSSYEPDYVFNLDQQSANRKFVIVAEGPFDAMAVDGVAVLGSEISEQQADIIDSLDKEVIVVPDFDAKVNQKTGKKVWAGRSLIEAALDHGWSVSFPVWYEQHKDIAEAAKHLGDLFVIKAILDAKESNPFKIELKAKQIYNKL